MPLTIEEVYGKVLKGKAVIVDGEMEILPGVLIHPAFRAHTAGSQLLEVPTSIGKLVFGSDAFSSYEGIRDWMTANVQQTDTVQQFLAYEKCYKITGGYNNCVAAHEPLSYTDKYPLTKNSWVALNGGRMAELALAPGEKSRKPRGCSRGGTSLLTPTASSWDWKKTDRRASVDPLACLRSVPHGGQRVAA